MAPRRRLTRRFDPTPAAAAPQMALSPRAELAAVDRLATVLANLSSSQVASLVNSVDKLAGERRCGS